MATPTAAPSSYDSMDYVCVEEFDTKMCSHGCEHACNSSECLVEINEEEFSYFCGSCNNAIEMQNRAIKKGDTGVLHSKYKIGVGLEGPDVGTSWLVPGDYAVTGAIGTNTTAVIAPGCQIRTFDETDFKGESAVHPEERKIPELNASDRRDKVKIPPSTKSVMVRCGPREETADTSIRYTGARLFFSQEIGPKKDSMFLEGSGRNGALIDPTLLKSATVSEGCILNVYGPRGDNIVITDEGAKENYDGTAIRSTKEAKIDLTNNGMECKTARAHVHCLEDIADFFNGNTPTHMEPLKPEMFGRTTSKGDPDMWKRWSDLPTSVLKMSEDLADEGSGGTAGTPASGGTPAPAGGEGLGTGAIVGIAVGGIVLLLAVVVALVFALRGKKKTAKPPPRTA